jgi:hypothetical protein
MLSILDSTDFKNDLQRYNEEVSKITNQQVKEDLENQVTKLVNAVKSLDNRHQELIFSRNIRDADQYRTKVTQLRKNIENRLRDWKDANPN